MRPDDGPLLAELTLLRDRGLGPVEVFRVALERASRMDCHRLILRLFPLSVREAKDVSLRATAGKTLEEHERELVRDFEENRELWEAALQGEDSKLR